MKQFFQQYSNSTIVIDQATSIRNCHISTTEAGQGDIFSRIPSVEKVSKFIQEDKIGSSAPTAHQPPLFTSNFILINN